MTLVKLETKKIDGGDGFYFIAKDGRVIHKKGTTKFITPSKDKKGVPYVRLRNKNKVQRVGVNVLLKKYWPQC